jgi:hypothetical protein
MELEWKSPKKHHDRSQQDEREEVVSSLAHMTQRSQRSKDEEERFIGWARRAIIRYYCGRLVDQSWLMDCVAKMNKVTDWPIPIAVWLGPKPDSSPSASCLVHVEYEWNMDVKQCDPVRVMRELGIPAVRCCVVPRRWKYFMWSHPVCNVCGVPTHQDGRCPVRRMGWMERRTKFYQYCTGVESINLVQPNSK